ncbi:MAG TPA: hypothetical protein VFH68_17215 [Polyangia bacterium]|jgi:hypothetical protein|nr:hypothetical protein [Polyangia bacterium]
MDARSLSRASRRRSGVALVITLAFAGAAALQACGSASTANNGGGFGGSSVAGTGGKSMGVDGGSDAASGAGGSLGAGGASSGAGGATGTGTGGTGVPVCRVRIVPLSAPSFTGIESGPMARLRVQGIVQGAVLSPVVWQWTVTFDGVTTVMPTTIDGAGSIIDFPIDKPGAYDITASLARESNCYRSEPVRTVEAQPTAFVLRATADGYPVKETRFVLGSDPQQAVPIQLDRGEPASLFPTRLSTGQALPSYLRVSRPASNFSLEGDTLHGPFSVQLLAEVSYDLLIVPNDAVAPDLLTGVPSSFAARTSLDPGVPVTATLHDVGSRPVAGARMVLRRGALPSTVGISDQSGALSLLARAGTLAAFIVPPVGAGLPRMSVGAASDPGIVLDAAAASLELIVSWDSVMSAPLPVEVHAPGGSAPVEGARVRAVSHEPGLRAGSLVARTAAGDVSLPALGSTDVELTTNASGRVVFAALPVGAYDVTIVPPATPAPTGGAAPAITEVALTVAVGGPVQMVTLARKGLLAGTLLPLSDSVGARVTAIDKSIAAPGTVVSATVAADGSYTISVDPGRAYQLLAEPASGTTRGRAVLETVRSAAGTTPVSPHTLPLVHVVPGVVTSGPAGPGVGGVLLQAFCVAASTRCLDPTLPLADAISAGNGSFELRLPEPAQN